MQRPTPQKSTSPQQNHDQQQRPSPKQSPNNQNPQSKDCANNAKNNIKTIISLPFSKTLAPKLNYITSVRNNKRVFRQSNQQEAQNLSQNKIQNNQNPQNPPNIPKNQNPNKEAKKEQKVLKISMFSSAFLAIFGIGFGVAVGSLSIAFDGFISLISVGLGALSVITSRYIYKEDDDVFQYGYVRFEPMVNLFKSLVLVFVCVYAFINALSSLLSGGYEVYLGGAAIYSMCAFIFCFVLFIYTLRASKALESDLIKVDNIEWKIDCVLYLGGIVAFGVIYVVLSGGGSEANTLDSGTLSKSTNALARYIDPALLCVLSSLLCISPAKIAIANFKDLIMVAPKELDEKITHIMEEISQKYGFRDYDTHTAKSGRFFMVEINILVRGDYAGKVADLDTIREEIQNAIAIPSYKIWLSVSWTTNPQWL